MKFRKHRGSLEESLATEIEITPFSLQKIQDLFRAEFPDAQISDESIHYQFYGIDSRLNVKTYLVSVDGFGVYGFATVNLYTTSKVEANKKWELFK